MSAVEKFPILLSEAEEESSAVPPCFSDEGINVRPLDTVYTLPNYTLTFLELCSYPYPPPILNFHSCSLQENTHAQPIPVPLHPALEPLRPRPLQTQP